MVELTLPLEFMITLNEGELFTSNLNDLIMEKLAQPLHYNPRHGLKCLL